jgi:hypothetical protein
MSKSEVSTKPEASNSGTTSQQPAGGGGTYTSRAVQLKREASGAGDFQAQEAALAPVQQMKRDASRAGDFQAQEAALTPVQRKGKGSAAGDVHAAAAHGTSGSAGALPHAAQIQRSFGAHDISHIKAHTDQAAAEGSAAMGAEAYASGDRVAFKGAPSLHTAAHEAAHIVQQQAGVQLSGGVGQAGDSYEQQADAVADAVVQGKDASHLLGAPGAAAQNAVQRAVQRKDDKAPNARPANATPAAPPKPIKRVHYSELNTTAAHFQIKYDEFRKATPTVAEAVQKIAAWFQNRLPIGWNPPDEGAESATAPQGSDKGKPPAGEEQGGATPKGAASPEYEGEKIKEEDDVQKLARILRDCALSLRKDPNTRKSNATPKLQKIIEDAIQTAMEPTPLSTSPHMVALIKAKDEFRKAARDAGYEVNSPLENH